MVRRQTKEERKKIIEHNRKLGIFHEDNSPSGGVSKRRKPTLDEYDNQGSEDNLHDLDWNLDGDARRNEWRTND